MAVRSNAQLLCLQSSYRFQASQIYCVDQENERHWYIPHSCTVSRIRKSDGLLVDYEDVPILGDGASSFTLVNSDMKNNEVIKRGRGRPVTGHAMTSAEKQAAYRARKAQKTVTVTFNRDAVDSLESHIRALAAGHDVPVSLDMLESILNSIRSATQSQLVSGA